jgi:hypothetical protein
MPKHLLRYQSYLNTYDDPMMDDVYDGQLYSVREIRVSISKLAHRIELIFTSVNKGFFIKIMIISSPFYYSVYFLESYKLEILNLPSKNIS